MASRLAGLSLVALPLALVAGCVTPAPSVHLETVASNATWVGGRLVEAQERDGVRVASTFDHHGDGRLAFRVEIWNGSDTALDVGPDAMTFNRYEEGEWSTKTTVIDPEDAIAALEAARSRELAQAHNDNLFLGPLLLLSVIGDVTSVASGKARSTTGLRSAAIAGTMEHRAARHANTVQQLGAEQEAWMNAALRRTRVPPGQGVSGLVFIPLRTQTRFVVLNVWADKLRFRFLFKQYVKPT